MIRLKLNGQEVSRIVEVYGNERVGLTFKRYTDPDDPCLAAMVGKLVSVMIEFDEEVWGFDAIVRAWFPPHSIPEMVPMPHAGTIYLNDRGTLQLMPHGEIRINRKKLETVSP